MNGNVNLTYHPHKMWLWNRPWWWDRWSPWDPPPVSLHAGPRQSECQRSTGNSFIGDGFVDWIIGSNRDPVYKSDTVVICELVRALLAPMEDPSSQGRAKVRLYGPTLNPSCANIPADAHWSSSILQSRNSGHILFKVGPMSLTFLHHGFIFDTASYG